MKADADAGSPFARAIGSRRRPVSEAHPFPGDLGEKGLRYRVRSLSDDEILEARLEALTFLRKRFRAAEKDGEPEMFLAADPRFFDEEFERQLLARSLRHAESPDLPFADAGELRLWLDPDARKALSGACAQYADERSPLRKVQTPEELNELIALVGKDGDSSVYLSYCDTASLRFIAHGLASRLIALMKPNFSST